MEEVKSSAPKSKADVIRESKLPEHVKEKYLREIGEGSVDSDSNKIPFAVFAKIKAIPQSLHGAMLVYPKAKGVNLATQQDWEQIFKNF